MFAVILYPDFSLHTERFVVKGVPGAYVLNISHLLQVCLWVLCILDYSEFVFQWDSVVEGIM